jgi:hypothetical protein
MVVGHLLWQFWKSTTGALTWYAIAAQFLATFKEFPPAQKAASFTIGQALEKMTSAATGGGAPKSAAAHA